MVWLRCVNQRNTFPPKLFLVMVFTIAIESKIKWSENREGNWDRCEKLSYWLLPPPSLLLDQLFINLAWSRGAERVFLSADNRNSSVPEESIARKGRGWQEAWLCFGSSIFVTYPATGTGWIHILSWNLALFFRGCHVIKIDSSLIFAAAK